MIIDRFVQEKRNCYSIVTSRNRFFALTNFAAGRRQTQFSKDAGNDRACSFRQSLSRDHPSSLRLNGNSAGGVARIRFLLAAQSLSKAFPVDHVTKPQSGADFVIKHCLEYAIVFRIEK